MRVVPIPVSRLVRVIVAPGTTALLSSRTVPTTVAVSNCAPAAGTKSGVISKASRSIDIFMRRIVRSAFQYEVSLPSNHCNGRTNELSRLQCHRNVACRSWKHPFDSLESGVFDLTRSRANAYSQNETVEAGDARRRRYLVDDAAAGEQRALRVVGVVLRMGAPRAD